MTNRIALCIGISSYTDEGIDSLPNAFADAELIHQSLAARGFDSELVTDATAADIESALQRLQAKGKSEPAVNTFTVIYFAGHGFEIGGLGFLLPTDFPGPVSLLRIPTLGLSTLQLVGAVSENAGPKLIILDACRLDAAYGSDASEVTRFNELVAAIKLKYPNVANADDIVFAFATSTGAPAGDGVIGHSPYCEALASNLLAHDQSLDQLLTAVAQKVIRSSKMRQRPWYHSSLTHPLYFSDLSTFTPFPFEVYQTKHDGHVTRIHPLTEARLAYSDGAHLLFARGHERKMVHTFDESIQAMGTRDGELYILFESGRLMHGYVNPRGGVCLANVCVTGFREAFALSVSPNGRTLVIVGMSGYQVIRRVKEKWQSAKRVESEHDFYNAKFFDDDSVVLCGSTGMVRELTNLRSSDFEFISRDAIFNKGGPVQDIEIVDGGETVVAVRTNGKIEFVDRKTWATVCAVEIKGAPQNVAQNYSVLREILKHEDVERYFHDRPAFLEMFADDPELIGTIGTKVERHSLLCCSLMKDDRVLAVGSEDGFVFLIDVRDHKHFRTIDVGGGLGKLLRWMCADLSSNAFMTLLNEGTLVRYQGVMPHY